MNTNKGSKKKHPIPPSLQKMGITSIKHDIPEGMYVNVPARAFNLVFGDAIQEFVKRGEKKND